MCFFNRNKVREFDAEICLNGDKQAVAEFSRHYMELLPEKYVMNREVYEDTDDALHFRLVLGANGKAVSDFELAMNYTELETCGTRVQAHMVGTGIVYKNPKQFFKGFIKKFGEIKQEQAQ